MQTWTIVEHKNKESESGYPHDGKYVVVSFCRMKNSTTRKWEDAVIYRKFQPLEADGGCYFVREKNDFMDKFKKTEL